MASEAKRGLGRIASNYVRLLSGFVVGLVLVPLQISWYGMEAFGLLSLVFGAVGISALFSEMIRNSMVRELGRAWHAREHARFLGVYNSSLLLSLAAALATGVLIAAMGGWLQTGLSVSGSLRPAAVMMLIAEGSTWIVIIVLAPINNQYAIRERFIEENLWFVLSRSNYLFAALFVRYALAIKDPAPAFEWFVVLSPLMGVAAHVAMAARLVLTDRQLVPRLGLANWRDARAVLGEFALNGMATLGYVFYESAPRFLTNVFQGTWVNGLVALAFGFVSYTRTVSLGMNGGLDAVATRVSTGRSTISLEALCRHATRLHAFTVMPCVVMLTVLMEPLLGLWVGSRLDMPGLELPIAVSLGIILLPQVAARSISDAWVRLLYGAGHVRRYAWMMLLGGAITLIVTWAGFRLLPEPRLTGISGIVPVGTIAMPVGQWTYDWWSVRWQALVLTVAYTAFQLGVLPWITARCLGTTAWRIVRPMARPTLASLLASPALAVAWILGSPPGGWIVLTAMALYGAVYAALAWKIVLTKSERTRVVAALRRRILPAATRPVPAEVSAAKREMGLEANEVVDR